MSALHKILQPVMEPMPKQEADDDQSTTTEVRRRQNQRKSAPPPEINKLGSPETSVTTGTMDERKRRWLAGLSHEELLGVAHGAVWQAGESHSKNCFNCKKEGTLLECDNCPRAYHRRCLDPPIHGNFKIDQPWFCPNCALLQLDFAQHSPTGMSRSGSAADQGNNGLANARLPLLNVGDVTPLHRSADLPSHSKSTSSRTTSSSRNIRTPLPEIQDRPHKRSRYTTLPEHIDEALGLLNRELESAHQSKGLVREMAMKIQVLEQELKLRQGQEVLLAREMERGFSPGKEMLEVLKREIDVLRRENKTLRAELDGMREEARRKEGENEEWRMSMKALIDGR